MQAYRQAYGANMDERLLKQLGIDQRILEGLIEEEAALAEAERLGIGASDQEVVARIRSLPAFQENGQFIGETRYRQVLNVQNPPLRPDEFEEQVRRGIVMEKLQGALTDWITVSEPEVDASSSAATRRSSSRSSTSPPTSSARRPPRPTRRSRRGSSRTRATTRFPRSARSSTR